MHDGEFEKSSRRPTKFLSRARMWATVALLGSAATLGAGCGGGNDPVAFSEFRGVWRETVDVARPSDYHLVCPTLPFDGQFPLFTAMLLEAGTVSDVYDTGGSGNCQFGFNVVPKMKALSIANPDPFTMKAPVCAVDLGSGTDPMTGHTIDTQLVITPTSWVFNLQAPVKDQAPAAQFIGHASVTLTDIDLDAVPVAVVGTSACTYDIRENLDKVAGP